MFSFFMFNNQNLTFTNTVFILISESEKGKSQTAKSLNLFAHEVQTCFTGSFCGMHAVYLAVFVMSEDISVMYYYC